MPHVVHYVTCVFPHRTLFSLYSANSKIWIKTKSEVGPVNTSDIQLFHYVSFNTTLLASNGCAQKSIKDPHDENLIKFTALSENTLYCKENALLLLKIRLCVCDVPYWIVLTFSPVIDLHHKIPFNELHSLYI